MRTNSPHRRPGWRRVGIAGLATAALALAGLGTAVHADATTSSKVTWTATPCATPKKAGELACDSLRVTGGTTAFQKAQQARGVTPKATTPTGYGPSDLRSAYGLTAAAASGGTGATVAIVDAYNDPNAESDLATYRSYYGLPACTTANGCFKKVSQTGSTTSLPSSDAGWSEEISLDLDMVSAIAPNAHILLVEATSPTMANLGKSVNEAVALGAKFVSNSYGGSESSSDTSYDSSYFNHPGVAITVSAGDSGYGAEYPAASKYVTSVGGTALSTASNARGWTESVWKTSSTEGTGSGCSTYDAKPTWQTDTGCTKRMISDVSAVADPATGVSVYDSYGITAGWYTFGGTSAAAPIIASVYALAGTPGSSDYPAQYPYKHTSALNDVTSGNNGTCTTSYFCTARSGYDGPTGWGTPEGVSAFTS
ncbi:S53 family peptidase [Streptomyces sp. BK205]|uniref:S53 family peptidase n=1 Tax=Streptomyces sp. BK205 TaxID=2512164 RepID=UPI00104CFB7A|nr:S53 family peptidase [Streptomyces sp. BK205]TCR21418.1 physarolisin II [Streptomyces sp. BK205]